jgi:hypothetical protein
MVVSFQVFVYNGTIIIDKPMVGMLNIMFNLVIVDSFLKAEDAKEVNYYLASDSFSDTIEESEYFIAETVDFSRFDMMQVNN